MCLKINLKTIRFIGRINFTNSEKIYMKLNKKKKKDFFFNDLLKFVQIIWHFSKLYDTL